MVKSKFIKNSLILMITTLCIKIMAMVFRIYVVSKIGAEGVGVYQLVLSVYFLCVTVSTSAISLCVTRMVTDCIGNKQEERIKFVVKICFCIALVISLTCSFLMYNSAEFLGKNFLGDTRTVRPLKILCLALPFMAVSSCFRGYFYAIRKASCAAIEQIIEQVIEITIFMFFIGKIERNNIEAAISLITFGSLVSEVVTCLYSAICYILNSRYSNSINKLPEGFRKKIIKILLPVTGSSCLRSGLNSIENTLIPRGLKKYGADESGALSDYGSISGMVMPILTFPSFILISFATLLIPEVSEYFASGKKKAVRSICEKSYSLTLLFVIPFTVGFIFMGNEIGEAIYNDNISGRYISLLAPIVPLMYIDSITDGILKGINEQLSYFTYNMIDSVIRVILSFVLIPLMGIKGYIVVIFVSEILNTALSINKLVKVTEFKISFFNDLIFPIISALLSMYLTKILIIINPEKKVFSLILFLIGFFIIYVLINTFIIYLNNLLFKRKNKE